MEQKENITKLTKQINTKKNKHWPQKPFSVGISNNKCCCIFWGGCNVAAAALDWYFKCMAQQQLHCWGTLLFNETMP